MQTCRPEDFFRLLRGPANLHAASQLTHAAKGPDEYRDARTVCKGQSLQVQLKAARQDDVDLAVQLLHHLLGVVVVQLSRDGCAQTAL